MRAKFPFGPLLLGGGFIYDVRVNNNNNNNNNDNNNNNNNNNK